MKTYHKIDSLFKRDPDNHYKTFTNEYARPEFEFLNELPWQATEKVDGTNIRISQHEMGGRTENSQIPTFLLPILTAIQKTLQESELPDETILIGEFI